MKSYRDMTEQEKAELDRIRIERHQKIIAYDEVFLHNLTARLTSESYSAGGNVCISPVSVWFVLTMLQLGASGSAKKRICEITGVFDDEDLISNTQIMRELVVTDDDNCKAQIASAIWANSDLGYAIKDAYTGIVVPIGTVCDTIGFSTDDIGNTFSAWDSKVAGAFAPPAPNVGKNAALLVANVLHFRGKWSDPFVKHMTTRGIFHSPNGDMEAMFMHSSDDSYVYAGKNFSAARLGLGHEDMTFVLPDDGVELNTLVDTPAKVHKLLNLHSSEKSRALIRWSVPKFAFNANMDIKGMLSKAGLCEQDGTDSVHSDLSGMLEGPFNDHGNMLSLVQSARIAIDEDGCEAASLTASTWACCGMLPSNEVEFKLDRPFAFVLTTRLYVSQDEYKTIPLFVGVVNDLAE